MKPFIKVKCDANWDQMIANTEGKFCNLCKKDVIDFTEKKDTEIKEYLNNNRNVCGKFSSEQIINTDITFNLRKFAKSKLSTLEKFAIISFLVFGLSLYSCNNPYALSKIKVLSNSKSNHLKSKLPIDIFEALQKRNISLEENSNKWEDDEIKESPPTFNLDETHTITTFGIVNNSETILNNNLFDWPSMYKWTEKEWDTYNRKQLRIKQVLDKYPILELLNNQNNFTI
jgi:hypothetical protein